MTGRLPAPQATRFVQDHTRLCPVPGVPEIRLHLATEAISLWEETETAFAQVDSPPPFWAFAWPGGQVLARLLLDRPELVKGRRVLDLGSGSGLVAVAAAKAGAAHVVASDVEPLSPAAIALNAAANAVEIADVVGDILDDPVGRAADHHTAGLPTTAYDVVLVGDLCYERPLAARVLGYLRRVRSHGADVLVGDPGRAYLPRAELRALAGY
ncbi:MAG TPA: 50S ribosomal protein L11 methyltransferase, partial [Actinopolymorphaceae bacterium]|nr:50S ribosomal protein L11 methyltransferase [Actinopolymorphaceae bacterium]